MPSAVNDFVVVFISIVLQSMPFVLIGVAASALVQEYLSERAVERWMSRSPLGGIVLGSVFGFVAPVCDCGTIPLARRLSAKGVSTPAAVAFIIAAPIVNPIVLLSTAVAFQGNWSIVVLRFGMALAVAIWVGVAASLLGMTQPLLPPVNSDAQGRAVGQGRMGALLAHASAEYADVIFFVVVGAAVTAAAQAFIPRIELLILGDDPVRSVAVLMPLASLLSICSEADAFVARAFADTFSPGSVVAFMVIGQIVDLRNGLLLWKTAGSRLTLLVATMSYALVFGLSVALNLLLLRS